MSHKKRKKLHKCHNHKKRNARGRCVSCGKWLCKCSRLDGGRFYCIRGCKDDSLIEPDFGDVSAHPVVPSKKTEKTKKDLRTVHFKSTNLKPEKKPF